MSQPASTCGEINSSATLQTADSVRLTACSGALVTARSRVAGTRCRAPAPSEPCVPLVAAHGSSKPRGRRGLKLLLFRFPALAGLQPALTGCVYQAGLVIMAGAGPPVVGEIAGGYRLAGDVQPAISPTTGGPAPAMMTRPA